MSNAELNKKLGCKPSYLQITKKSAWIMLLQQRKPLTTE